MTVELDDFEEHFRSCGALVTAKRVGYLIVRLLEVMGKPQGALWTRFFKRSLAHDQE